MIALLRVDYVEAEAEVYALPLAFVPDAEPERQERLRADELPRSRGSSPDRRGAGLLYDPFGDPAWLAAARGDRQGERFRGPSRTSWRRSPRRSSPELRGEGDLEPAPLKAEQSNTSVRFGDRLILKLFRKLEAGVNPDLEIGRFLTEQTDFRHIPRVAGALEIRGRGQRAGDPRHPAANSSPTRGTPGATPSMRSAASSTACSTELGEPARSRGAAVPAEPLIAPRGARDRRRRLRAHRHLRADASRLLAERTAELHIALASGRGKDFAPEPFSELYQRSLYDSMRSLTKKNLRLLRASAWPRCPEAVRAGGGSGCWPPRSGSSSASAA